MNAPVQPAAANRVNPQTGVESAPAKPSPAPAVAPSAAGPAATPTSVAAPSPAVQADATPVRIVVPAASLPQLPTNTIVNATVGPPLPDGRISLHIQSSPQLTLQVPWPSPPPPGVSVHLRLSIAGQTATLSVLRPASHRPSSPHPDANQHSAPARIGNLVRGTFQSTPNTAASPSTQSAPPNAAPSGPLALRIIAINPSAQHQSIPLQPGAGQTTISQSTGGKSAVSAGVVGPASSTLTTAHGIVTLDQPLRLPAGSQIIFRVEAGRLPFAEVHHSPLNNLTNALPSLRDAMDVLSIAAPAEANLVRDSVLPSTGPRLATGMLFFLSALAGGTLQGWFGETAGRRLQHLPVDARTGNLADEFARLARAAGEPLNGDWRAMAMPIMHGDELDNLRLFIHRDESSASDDAAGTRFIVEADLTHIGPVQLDGLIPNPQRFDLTLRSTRPLGAQPQQDLRELFAEAGAAANFAGHLIFEVLPALPTPALAETPRHTVGMFA